MIARQPASATLAGAALLLLGACGGPPAPPLRNEANRNDATAVACRAEAERVVRYRDRGQTMRSDDYNARVGTTSYLGPQVITDNIAQVYDRDRIAAECVRGAREGTPIAPDAPPPGPAPRR